MLCYNCRWGETSAARKYFDVFMRQILFDMKDLLALRSWCGILREKTVIDLAMARADYLVVLDLGTIATKVNEHYSVCYYYRFRKSLVLVLALVFRSLLVVLDVGKRTSHSTAMCIKCDT